MIRSLGEHHLLRAMGPCRDARVNVSRRRRLRDAHRIQPSTGLPMPRRRRLMARAPLRMGMKLERLLTVDSMRVCEHDIVFTMQCHYNWATVVPCVVTVGERGSLIPDAAVLPYIGLYHRLDSLRFEIVRVLYYTVVVLF